MRVHRAPAETRHVLHVSAQRGSWLLYNSAMGAPLFYPRTLLWSSTPAFLLICRTTTHRCLRVLQRVGVGVGVGAGVLSWSEERRLSQACVPTDWGRKDANTDSATRAPAAAVVVEVRKMLGTPERADWPPVAVGHVLAVAFFLCRTWNEKSKDSPGPGGLTLRQIPGVDVERHSCLPADLGPGKTLFLPILLCLPFLDINQ